MSCCPPLEVVLSIALLLVPPPDEIGVLRAQVADLEARGGKALLSVYGSEKWLCVEIDTQPLSMARTDGTAF